MMDLMVVAWQTDMTRVTTFMLAREGSNRSYREIGVSDGHHSCTHHQNDPEKIAKTIKINDASRQASSRTSSNKLKTTPDGDGTLLDHSMILYGSSIADGNAHTHVDLPLALVGGGAGRSRADVTSGTPTETPMNNLLLSMLDKVGRADRNAGRQHGQTGTPFRSLGTMP